MSQKILYHGPVKGVTFEPARSNLRKLVKFLQGLVREGEQFEIVAKLEHEPNNRYDPNAIKVHVGVDDALFFVGHVAKEFNQQILAVGIENVGVIIEKFNKDLEEVIKGINIVVKGNKIDQIDQNHSDPVDCD
jgi:hypothetical protein